jgi:hypothetical protein
VLVTGTVVYGRGDGEGDKRQLAEAVQGALASDDASVAAAAEAAALGSAAAAEAAPLLARAQAAAGGSAPLGVAGRSEPIVVSSSLKATMSIVSGSYSRWRACARVSVCVCGACVCVCLCDCGWVGVWLGVLAQCWCGICTHKHTHNSAALARRPQS